MTAPRGKVLLVDDDVRLLEVLGRVIGRQHDVQVANSVDAALEALAAYEPDVILCDVRLPGRPGTDLFATLRTTARALADRITFLSGATWEAESVRSLGRPVLVKPIDPSELRAHLAQRVALVRGG